MELNGWASPQTLTRYGASAPGCPRPPQLRPCHDRHSLTPAARPRHAQETARAGQFCCAKSAVPALEAGCSPGWLQSAHHNRPQRRG
jgi:hypothetical protein